MEERCYIIIVIQPLYPPGHKKTQHLLWTANTGFNIFSKYFSEVENLSFVQIKLVETLCCYSPYTYFKLSLQNVNEVGTILWY